MCLLINQSADTSWNQADIEDFYSRNKDGIGIMWAEGNVLYTEKILPKDKQDAVDFLLPHNGKACLVHYRMATHGNHDLEQCHPYLLLDEGSGHPIYLMHNGVLPCDDSKDVTKSDTWHYIETHLRPLLDPRLGGNPELIFNPIFQDILGDAIGHSNKFCVMDYLGRIATINEHVFVDHKGSKLSNTYAWSSPKKASTFNYAGFGGSTWTSNFKSQYPEYDGDDVMEESAFDSYYHGNVKAKPSLTTPLREVDQYYEDLDAEAEAVMAILEDNKLDEAITRLRLIDIADFIECVGANEVWDATEALIDGELGMEDYIAYMRNPMLYVSDNNTEIEAEEVQ